MGRAKEIIVKIIKSDVANAFVKKTSLFRKGCEYVKLTLWMFFR
jgi:hypothetical protein